MVHYGAPYSFLIVCQLESTEIGIDGTTEGYLAADVIFDLVGHYLVEIFVYGENCRAFFTE
jgi:hypothetical protein